MAKCKYESHLDQEKCPGFKRNVYGRCMFTRYCPLEVIIKKNESTSKTTPKEIQEVLDEFNDWGTDGITWPYKF